MANKEIKIKKKELEVENKYKVLFMFNVSNAWLNYKEWQIYYLNEKQLLELKKFIKLV